MTLKEAARRILTSQQFRSLRDTLARAEGPVHVREAAGSMPAFIITGLATRAAYPLLVCVLPEEDAARYLLGDLEHLAATGVQTLHLPPSGFRPYDDEHVPDDRAIVARAEVLQQLADGFEGVLVVSAEALHERVASQRALETEATRLHVGQTIDLAALLTRLEGQGFARTEFVQSPGEIAVRGGLIDVYPYAGDYPVRIELFGDDIESIREFDPSTQRSVSRLDATRLLPNLDLKHGRGEATSLFAHLPENMLLVTFDESRVIEKIGTLHAEAAEAFAATDSEHRPAPPDLYLTRDEAQRAIQKRHRLLFGLPDVQAAFVLAFGATPQPPFNSKMQPLRHDITAKAAEGLAVTLLCDTAGQRARLAELLETLLELGQVEIENATLHEGFVFPEGGFALYTDHQVFNRYHRPTSYRSRRRVGGLSLRDLQNLSPGDFVVHLDHGIGKFAGMQTITVRDKQQEAVRLLFSGGDTLFVNVNALYKLSRFTGQEGHQPQLTKLGSGTWERSKAKTKKRVKDIARDLIALYARRLTSQGHRFPPDTLWQRELEASFEFEDTPDQAAAAEAVKVDMEKPIPMDRLVCGDVGFGKTEVAVRAAFKAVQDGKQVGVLVPTTILAAQHFDTFKKRLEGYPVRVEVLSRFRNAAQQRETLKRIASGEVDIVVGTQRLASKDVKFKNLGLLIIDEEQRFGVGVKEKLRSLRTEVDTVTLTATPIPRTLQFSLMGARDLSIIRTPPPNRQPIVTEIHSFDQRLIKDAILHETSRSGQVFFIHNRVQSIEEIAIMLRALAPGVRIRVAHGQMKASELEDVMMDFQDKKFDVLVSTNIIESGLDISNANTILINHAERFGLAEIHQLRGRVGRSDRKAYCYLLVPSIHALTREARQRLQAVEEFSDLGSGFNIAMRDLDIRGAGNLLGAEQSGFVAELGFETYQRILEEAVQELRHTEFSDLFAGAPPPRAGETTLDVEEDALLPETYVSNSVERLNLYRRIAEAQQAEDLTAIGEELADRFGPTPLQVTHLLEAAQLRLSAQALRLPRVQYKNQRLFLDMPAADADAYFYDTLFQSLLEKLETIGRRYVLKDSGKKLRVIVQSVPTLSAAREVMQQLSLTAEVTAVSMQG